MKKLARITSYIFVPPVNLLLVFIFLSLNFYDNTTLQIKTISIAAIFGFIIPLLVFFYLRLKREIIDNDASDKRERTIPYLIGIALSIFGAVLSMVYELHPFIIALWFSYIFTSAVLVIINFRWKISAHAIGVSIPFAVLIFVLGSSGYCFIVIPIIVSWSRIYQNLHNLSQVLAGLALGYVVTFYLLNLSISLN